MEFTVDYVVSLYERVKTKYRLPDSMKEKQVDGIVSILNGNNTLCVLPTGYGKSLVFTLLPLLLDEVRLNNYEVLFSCLLYFIFIVINCLHMTFNIDEHD